MDNKNVVETTSTPSFTDNLTGKAGDIIIQIFLSIIGAAFTGYFGYVFVRKQKTDNERLELKAAKEAKEKRAEEIREDFYKPRRGK